MYVRGCFFRAGGEAVDVGQGLSVGRHGESSGQAKYVVVTESE
jgi:hypothetical protein